VEDVEAVFDWGRRFGVVWVNGVPMRPKDGFQIGAPEAAGGSELTVSKREHDFVKEKSSTVRWFLGSQCFMARWVDDVVHVVPRRGPKEAKEAIKEMESLDFYKGLELKPEEGTRGFGFEFVVENGILLVRSINKAERELDDDGTAKKEWPEAHGGSQYGGAGWKAATVMGRVCRILDMTNESQADTMEQVRRCLTELSLRGFDDETIEKAMRRMSRAAWCDVMRTTDVLMMSEKEKELYCLEVDFRRALRVKRSELRQVVARKIFTWVRKIRIAAEPRRRRR